MLQDFSKRNEIQIVITVSNNDKLITTKLTLTVLTKLNTFLLSYSGLNSTTSGNQFKVYFIPMSAMQFSNTLPFVIIMEALFVSLQSATMK